jgi:hypothetical protein
MVEDPFERLTFDEAGAYVPYTGPLPVPDAEITDEPLVSLCINENWLPYILGATKQLARFEIWAGDTFAQQFAVDNAQTIPEQVQDGCGSVEPTSFNWYFNVDIPSGYWNLLSPGFSDFPSVFFYSGDNGFGGSNPRVQFTGLEATFGGDHPAGGPVYFDYRTLDNLPHLFTWSYTNCADESDGGTFVAATGGFVPTSCKFYDLQCSHPFIVMAQIVGDYMCIDI